MTEIPQIDMAAEAMIEGELYIWDRRCKNDSTCDVVRLNDSNDGLHLLNGDGGWDYYFEDDLIGTLHGPITLPPNA